MALLHRIPTDFGIDACYWHIRALELNRVERRLTVLMAGYVDEAARRADRRPVATVAVPLADTDYPGGDDALSYAAVYAAVRRAAAGDHPASLFTGAVDA